MRFIYWYTCILTVRSFSCESQNCGYRIRFLFYGLLVYRGLIWKHREAIYLWITGEYSIFTDVNLNRRDGISNQFLKIFAHCCVNVPIKEQYNADTKVFHLLGNSLTILTSTAAWNRHDKEYFSLFVGR